MSREFLHAYLRSQEAHKAIHQLTKAFEADATDAELMRQLGEVQRLLNMVYSFLQETRL
ncbi:hypothetical protein H6F43_03485 [Leptolyngbya sp. FACHB-36]|uniref:hypothetical protein n=1 Tax=Leptolyngbya sp. FACHB-36 TaxID=2692808 RepID=UPI0016813C88|nr:hypothetical protein [Leptolyngbya sp. FACHB-36]MBD2019244.1 hypothetical protein [Leptolyngbya sp. FACHB-36]